MKTVILIPKPTTFPSNGYAITKQVLPQDYSAFPYSN
jgi:hypothetical protein